MYTHTHAHTRSHSHTPSHLHVCTPELSEGVRHRQTLGCPDRHTSAVTPKPPVVLGLAPAWWKESLERAGTPRLWLQPMAHPLERPRGWRLWAPQREEDGRWGLSLTLSGSLVALWVDMTPVGSHGVSQTRGGHPEGSTRARGQGLAGWAGRG